MSATLVSSNTTIKVNGAVAATSVAGSSGTLYTASSNEYAIINVYYDGAGTITFTVGGRIAGPVTTNATSLQGIYVGPSQAVAWSSNTTELSDVVQISGVEFVNTP